MTLTQLEDRLAKWHKNKFGTRDIDFIRTVAKGTEELGELSKALLKRDWNNASEEVCDVFFVLLHIARGLGMDLMTEAALKLDVIEKRLEGK